MKQKAKILIVEDEGIQAMSLEETLEQAGFTVVGIADNGVEALRYVLEEEVDIVVMDIHIKGEMDGIETVHKMRARNADIPVIYLTAYMDQETVRRAQETSPAAYITKPYRQMQLLSSIESAVAGQNDAGTPLS